MGKRYGISRVTKWLPQLGLISPWFDHLVNKNVPCCIGLNYGRYAVFRRLNFEGRDRILREYQEDQEEIGKVMLTHRWDEVVREKREK